jgi:excisionase family DNA binding protein
VSLVSPRARLEAALAPELLDAFQDLIAEQVRVELERLEATGPRSGSPFVTVAEAAMFMRCSRQRVYDLLSARRLTRHCEGRRVLIARAELEMHLSSAPRPVALTLPHAPRTRSGSGVAR